MATGYEIRAIRLTGGEWGERFSGPEEGGLRCPLLGFPSNVIYGLPFLSVWIHITAEDLRSCNTLRGCVVQMLVHTFVVVLNRPIWPIWLRDWCIYYMSIWRGYRARERSIKFGPISRRVNISFICPHALVWLFPPKSIFLPICRFAVYSAYNIGTGEPCKISAPVSGIVSGTI